MFSLLPRKIPPKNGREDILGPVAAGSFDLSDVPLSSCMTWSGFRT